MPAACFVCSECGAADLPEHVVLDRPCPACDADNDAMGLAQCAECLDPVVPRWSTSHPGTSPWVHAVDKRACVHDVPRLPRILVSLPVIPLVGMRAAISVLGTDQVWSAIFGSVDRVARRGRFDVVGILRDDGGRTNASLRPTGEWRISGHSADKPAGLVTFFLSRSTR